MPEELKSVMPVWDSDRVVALAILAATNMNKGRIFFMVLTFVFLSLVDWRTFHDRIGVFSVDQSSLVRAHKVDGILRIQTP